MSTYYMGGIHILRWNYHILRTLSGHVWFTITLHVFVGLVVDPITEYVCGGGGDKQKEVKKISLTPLASSCSSVLSQPTSHIVSAGHTIPTIDGGNQLPVGA